MCTKPILQQPDYTKAFFLTTDALAYGMGAILSQERELNPRTQKTNALSSHILFKHVHTNRKELQHLLKRVPRSLKSLKMLQTTCCSYRNSSHYTHGPC